MNCPNCSSNNINFGSRKNLCEDCDFIFPKVEIQEEKKDFFNGTTYTTTTYPVFTGNRNLGEKRLDKELSFEEVIRTGFDLCHKYNTNCFTIEQMKNKSWYIKGYKGKYRVEQIKEILEFNKKMNPPLYPGKCFLIEF